MTAKRAEPRISLADLVEIVFKDQAAARRAALTQIRKACTSAGYRYPLNAALDKLEYYTKQSKAKCLVLQRDWRVWFEASEAFRILPEQLIEEEKRQHASYYEERLVEKEKNRVRGFRDRLGVLSDDIKQFQPTKLDASEFIYLQRTLPFLAEAQKTLQIVCNKLDHPKPAPATTE